MQTLNSFFARKLCSIFLNHILSSEGFIRKKKFTDSQGFWRAAMPVNNSLQNQLMQLAEGTMSSCVAIMEFLQKTLSEVSIVTQKASFTILAIKMHNASALYAET